MHGTQEERQRFAAALTKVALVTPKREKPDAPTIRLFYEALSDLGIETIEDVAADLIRNEPNMLGIPPPGRWRQAAEEYFDLKAQREVYHSPKGPPACDHCDDTGWRLVRRKDGARYVVTCFCRGGTNVEADEGPQLVARETTLVLDGEIGPQPNETELQRRRREHGNRIVHCFCCGTSYRIRTGWKCCAPPSGMRMSAWMAQWHLDCPTPVPHATGSGKSRCPQHCCCPPELRAKKTALLPMPKDGEHLHDFAVRLGIRDKDAPKEAPEPTPEFLESEFPEDEPPPPTDEDR